RTFAERLASGGSGVVATEDARGEWLWAFAPVAVDGDTASAPPRLFLTMAAPATAVTERAEETRARIRAETREELRSALGHAALGLALALAAIALVTVLGRGRGDDDA